jgi:hypothetical protein
MDRRVSATENTFPVADVPPATTPLQETPSQEAVKRLLASERLTKGKAYRPLEACSRRTSGLVAQVDHHPLIAALRLAYADHRPISLSPDMIWLLICQGVAHHINANPEELRHHFVQHPGRFTLEVKRDEVTRFKKGSPDNPWPEVFGDFSRQIRDHIGPAHDLFIPSFSTTGPTERAASEIALLDSMRAYFHYLHTTVNSGIPAITLEGTLADWQAIVERLEGFAPLGLEWWLAPLRPILQQFPSAAAGNVDLAFWKSMHRIYHSDEASNADSGVGWIGVFFPYLTDGQGFPTEKNPWLSSERDLDEMLSPEQANRPSQPRRDLDPGFLDEGLLPSGLAKAPFTWDERDAHGRLVHRWEMELLGGFVGVAQDQATLRLRPEIGWAVRERPAQEQ